MSKKIKVLVTAVGAPPGRNVVEALKDKANLEIFVADADPLIPIMYDSKHIQDSFVLPKAGKDGKYIDSIGKIIKKAKIDVVIPCIEEEIFLLSKNTKDINIRRDRLVCADYACLKKLADKKSVINLAKNIGIPVPYTCDAADIHINMENLGFPFIIKPRIGHGARDICIINDKKQFSLIPEKYFKDGCRYIAQSYIEGDTGSIFMCGLLYGKNNTVKAEFLSRSIKTLYDFGGPAVCGQPIKGFERIVEFSKNLVTRIGGWYGPVAVEYKVSSRDGLAYIMEVNPRFWGYGSMAVKSGINFPLKAVKEAMGEANPFENVYSDDVVILRETVDIPVPRNKLKDMQGKILLVIECNGKSQGCRTFLKKKQSFPLIDKIVFTGDSCAYSCFKADKVKDVAFYMKQSGDDLENYYEIGFYYSAKILVVVRDADGKNIGKKIEKDLKTILKKHDGQINIKGDGYFICHPERNEIKQVHIS